jgi:hypothetical protein
MAPLGVHHSFRELDGRMGLEVEALNAIDSSSVTGSFTRLGAHSAGVAELGRVGFDESGW